MGVEDGGPPADPTDPWRTRTQAHRQADQEAAGHTNGNRPNLASYEIDWPTFWGKDPATSEWLLEPLIAARRAHALYAGAKAGKSWLMLAAAASLATGRPFLGHPTSPPIDVVYSDWEMSEADLRERLEDDFGYGPDDDLSHLHYLLLPSMPGLDTAAGGHQFVEYTRDTASQLAILDTVARAVDGPENDADTYRDMWHHTGLPLKQADIAWVRLDHSGKDPTKGQRGSSAKDGDVDIVWNYTRTETGAQLKATHRRMAWIPQHFDITILIEPDTGRVTHQLTAGDGPTWPAGTREGVLLLDQLGIPPEASMRVAQKALKGSGHPMRWEIVQACVRWRRDTKQKPLLTDLGHTPDTPGHTTAAHG